MGKTLLSTPTINRITSKIPITYHWSQINARLIRNLKCQSKTGKVNADFEEQYQNVPPSCQTRVSLSLRKCEIRLIWHPKMPVGNGAASGDALIGRIGGSIDG